MANEGLGLSVRLSPPRLKPAGWEFQSDYTTQPAAAQKHFHSSFIRHKPALGAGNDRGVRAEGLFNLERPYGVVLIEYTSFIKVLKCRTGALGSPRIDEPDSLRESLRQNEENATRHDSILGGTKTTTKHGEDT